MPLVTIPLTSVQYEFRSRFTSLSLPNVASFMGFHLVLSHIVYIIFISSSNQLITNNAHGLHGSTKTINALALGVSGSTKFNNFGGTNSIGTSPNPSAFTSTSII